MSSSIAVVAIVAVLVLIVVIGTVLALTIRRRRPAETHRPLDPSVIRCFPPGHPREGEPIPPGEAPPSPGTAQRDAPRG